MISKKALNEALDYGDDVDILVQGPLGDRDNPKCRFILIQRAKDQKYAIIYGHATSMNFLTYFESADETRLHVCLRTEEKWYMGSGLVIDLLNRDRGGRHIFMKFRDKVKDYFR